MEFFQSRHYIGFDISYEFRYDFDYKNDIIEGEITIKSGDSLEGIESTESPTLVGGLNGSMEIENPAQETLLSEFELEYSDSNEKSKILIHVSDSDDALQETLHIKLPKKSLIKFYHQLSDHTQTQQAKEKLAEILDEEGSELDINNTVNMAPFAQTRSEFIRMFDEFVRLNSDISTYVRDIFKSSLIEWVFKDGTGKYYHISSVKELQDAVDEYNSYEHTEDIDRHILDVLIDEREKYITRGFNGLVIQDFGRGELPYYQVSPENFILMIGYIINEKSLTYINDSLCKYQKDEGKVAEISDVLYTNSANDIISVRTQLPLFAAEGEKSEVRYGLAYLIHNYLERNSVANPTAAYLYQAITKLCTDTRLSWLAEHAQHKHHLKLGEDVYSTDHDEALRHFDEAIVALSEADSWSPDPKERLWAVFRKTDHKATMFKDNQEYEKAIGILEEREDLMKEIGESSPEDYYEKIDNRVTARKHELRAAKYVDNDQLERAKEFYNEAAKYYKKAGFESLFKGVKGRQLQIDALLSEIKGDFSNAASIHNKYTNVLPSSEGAIFHEIRHHVCLAKEAAKNQNYEEGIAELNEIDSNIAPLEPQQEQLLQVLQAAKKFNNDEVIELESHFDSLTGSLKKKEDRILDFSDDYTTGHLTILAAQRLTSLPIDQQLLSEIITIAIHDSCLPKAPDDKISTPSEITASPTVGQSEQWQLTLPNHIIHSLDQLRMDKQTATDDYNSLVRDLSVITEQLLKVPREYYSKKYWGDNWRSHAPGQGDVSIGDLYEFFDTPAAKDINASDEVIGLFNKQLVEETEIRDLRNALAHGRDPNVTEELHTQISKEQFDKIYQAVTDVFRVITPDLPVIGRVDRQLGMNTYKIDLKWGGLPKGVWITTEYDLEPNRVYYFPRYEFDEEYERTISLPEGEITICEGDVESHFEK